MGLIRLNQIERERTIICPTKLDFLRVNRSHLETIIRDTGVLIYKAKKSAKIPCMSANAAIMGLAWRDFSLVRFMNIFILICCCSVSTMLALSASSCLSFVMVVSVSSCSVVRLLCNSETWVVRWDTCNSKVLLKLVYESILKKI